MKKLKVLSPYRSNRASYDVGQIIEVEESFAVWLMADCPGCFEDLGPVQVETVAEPESKALAEPPEDKMIAGDDLAKKSYRDLQALAKELGLPARGSTDELVERIRAAR